MAAPSSVRALEQRGSEEQPQGEKKVSILRFIIHWSDPGRRQPVLGELGRRGGSVGGSLRGWEQSVRPERGSMVAHHFSKLLLCQVLLCGASALC